MFCDLGEFKKHRPRGPQRYLVVWLPEEHVPFAERPAHADLALFSVDLVLDALQYQVAIVGGPVVGPQQLVERRQHFVPEVERFVPHSVRITCKKREGNAND